MSLLEKLQTEKANLEHQLKALEDNGTKLLKQIEVLRANGNAISGALQLVSKWISEEEANLKSLAEKAKEETNESTSSSI